MKISRRKLFGTIGRGAAYIAVLTSFPSIVWAKWNKTAFASTDLKAAIAARYGDMSITDSDKITLEAPEIAENGAVVPIKFKSSFDDVKSISVFVEKNPSPLVATFNLGEGGSCHVSVRIRMGKTSNVIVLFEVDGKLYRASQEVKVTIGGCGG